MFRALILAFLTTLAIPVVALPGLTGEAHAADTARVTVALVKAERGEPAVDKGLEAFQRDLSALPFTRFERVGSSTWKGGVGESTTLDVGGGVTVKITIEAVKKEGAVLVVDVIRGGKTVSHTTVSRPWGRAQVLSAGRDGSATLVVPVLADR